MRFGNADSLSMINSEAISQDRFRQILLEMKRCSLNSSAAVCSLDSLTAMLNKDLLLGLNPIMILNYQYNEIAEFVIDSNLLNIINGKFYDVGERIQTPYKTNQIFLSCPGVSINRDTIARFYLDEKFLFTNTLDSILEIQIDFDDGIGYRTMYFGDTIQITYLALDTFNIKIQVIFENFNGYSQSDFKEAGDGWEDDIFDERHQITATLSYDGLPPASGLFTIN